MDFVVPSGFLMSRTRFRLSVIKARSSQETPSAKNPESSKLNLLRDNQQPISSIPLISFIATKVFFLRAKIHLKPEKN